MDHFINFSIIHLQKIDENSMLFNCEENYGINAYCKVTYKLKMENDKLSVKRGGNLC